MLMISRYGNFIYVKSKDHNFLYGVCGPTFSGESVKRKIPKTLLSFYIIRDNKEGVIDVRRNYTNDLY